MKNILNKKEFSKIVKDKKWFHSLSSGLIDNNPTSPWDDNFVLKGKTYDDISIYYCGHWIKLVEKIGEEYHITQFRKIHDLVEHLLQNVIKPLSELLALSEKNNK